MKEYNLTIPISEELIQSYGEHQHISVEDFAKGNIKYPDEIIITLANGYKINFSLYIPEADSFEPDYELSGSDCWIVVQLFDEESNDIDIIDIYDILEPVHLYDREKDTMYNIELISKNELDYKVEIKPYWGN